MTTATTSACIYIEEITDEGGEYGGREGEDDGGGRDRGINRDRESAAAVPPDRRGSPIGSEGGYDDCGGGSGDGNSPPLKSLRAESEWLSPPPSPVAGRGGSTLTFISGNAAGDDDYAVDGAGGGRGDALYAFGGCDRGGRATSAFARYDAGKF